MPIDMILFCPACGLQHIDEPDDPSDPVWSATPEGDREHTHWTNPPHRSHLCLGCGHIWRPADVATNGVRSITTRGRNDSQPVKPARRTGEPRAALLSFNGDTSTWLVKTNPWRSYQVNLARPGVLNAPMSRRLIVRIQPTNRRICGYLVVGRVGELINSAGGDARLGRLLQVMDYEQPALKAQSGNGGRPYNEADHARDIIRREAREQLSNHYGRAE